jgi:hypothetical protein
MNRQTLDSTTLAAASYLSAQCLLAKYTVS